MVDQTREQPEGAHQPVRGSRPSPLLLRLGRRIVAAVAGVVCLVCGVLALGAAAPRLPVVGTLGSFISTPLAPQLLVVALVATVATLATRPGIRSLGAVLGVAGLAASVMSLVVLHGHVRAGERAGADVDVAQTFRSGTIAGAAANETVTFTVADGQALRLRIYRPASAAGVTPGRSPVVMYVHGGGWTGGTPDDQAANLRWFADRGYLAVAPEYVLATSTHPTWDTAGPQVACALAFVGAHAADYGGDPQQLFAWGESAGGALALSTSYAAAQHRSTSSCGGSVPTLRAVAAMFPGVDPAGIDANPDLVLGLSARTFVRSYLGGSPETFPDRARAVTTATYLSPDAPPTLLMLSNNDHLVPITGSLTFARTAQDAGVDVDVVRFPYADHGLNLMFHGAPNQAMLQLMLTHFHEHAA